MTIDKRFDQIGLLSRDGIGKSFFGEVIIDS